MTDNKYEATLLNAETMDQVESMTIYAESKEEAAIQAAQHWGALLEALHVESASGMITVKRVKD